MERLELSTELEDVIGTAERAREKREQRQPGPSQKKNNNKSKMMMQSIEASVIPTTEFVTASS